MNKLKIFSFVFLCGLILSPFFASADVILPGTHYIDLCAKVVNLDSFPNIVLIGKTSGPMAGGDGISLVKNNTCISKGYKFNSLDLYWNTKEKPKVIDADKLLVKEMDVYAGYADDSSPIIKQTVEYTLFTAGEGFKLLKTKETTEYNNGSPIRIKNLLDSPRNSVDASKIKKILKMGMKNDENVKMVQKYLNIFFKTDMKEDGNFGLQTKKAVMDFQKNYMIKVDGSVGPKTLMYMK